MYWEEASTLPSVDSKSSARLGRLRMTLKKASIHKPISGFIFGWRNSIKSNYWARINLTLQRTTKNSLSLPIKLSKQLELVASLIQIEQRCINPNMRVEIFRLRGTSLGES